MASFKKRHAKYKEVKTASGEVKLQPPAEVPSDAAQALVEVMCISSCVDGILVEGETEDLARQILDTPGFLHLDADGLANTLANVAKKVSEEGLDARAKAIAKALGPDRNARDEAFTLASVFVLYDGEVGPEEQEWLDMLQRALEISDEEASHITAVLAEHG